jgi:hypothetical protein
MTLAPQHLGMARSTLARAVEHLVLGRTVQQAARLGGYANVTKIIVMFRGQVRTTPPATSRAAKSLRARRWP